MAVRVRENFWPHHLLPASFPISCNCAAVELPSERLIASEFGAIPYIYFFFSVGKHCYIVSPCRAVCVSEAAAAAPEHTELSVKTRASHVSHVSAGTV